MNRAYPNYAKSIQELLGTTRKCIREIGLYAQQLNDFVKMLIPVNKARNPTDNLRAELLLLKLSDLQKRNEVLKNKQLDFLEDLKTASIKGDPDNLIFLNVAHIKLKTEAFNFLQLFFYTEKEVRDLDERRMQLFANQLDPLILQEHEVLAR